MAKTVAGLRSYAIGLFRSWQVSINKSVKVGADLYLQQEFNLKPLLSDINAIRRRVSSAAAKFDRMLGRNARPSTFHWTTTFVEGQSFRKDSEVVNLANQTQLIYPRLDGSLMIEREVRTSPTVFCLTVQYTPYWSDVQKRLSTLLAYLDALGVNLNPGIVWNAIPWSFVVDWLLKIGNLLDSFAMAWTEPLMIINQCCASIKRQRSIHCVLRHGVNLPSVIPNSTTITPITTEESYIRIPVSLSYSSLEASGLTPKEVSLGAALALSRKRNRTRRR